MAWFMKAVFLCFSGIWGLCMISTAGYNQAHRASSAFQFDHHRHVQHCDSRFLSATGRFSMGLTQFTIMKRWGSMGKYGEVWGSMGKYGEVWGSMGKYGEHDDTLNIHLMNQRSFFVLFWLSSLTIPEDLSHCCWDSRETTWSLIMQWSVHLPWYPFEFHLISVRLVVKDTNHIVPWLISTVFPNRDNKLPHFFQLVDTCRKFGDILTLQRFDHTMHTCGLDAKQSCLFRFVSLARHLHSLRYDTRGCIRTSCDMLPNKSSCDWEIETNLGFWMYFIEKVDCCWPESSNIELNFGFHCHVFSHFILTWCSHWTPFCAEAKVSASRFWRGRWPTSTCRAWSRYGLLPYWGKRVRRWHYLQHTEHIES